MAETVCLKQGKLHWREQRRRPRNGTDLRGVRTLRPTRVGFAPCPRGVQGDLDVLVLLGGERTDYYYYVAS